MSKLTAIENAIIQLGAGEFQKFCDTFLSKMDKYGVILGYGMKTGTLKTTIGNPDTYFVRENGKYVFVVYTTQQDNIYNKIQEDIEKCFDRQKTGVELSDIEEIVCCHTSSNLSAGDDQKLHKMCFDKGILLTIYGVDEIAQQIYSNYPVIARDFLGIEIDTNQIMSAEEFVKQYDSSETAAPLDTVFQNRVEELESLKDYIRGNKAVVVHGQAGVGKTRIVLEAAQIVAQKDGYKLLCVKSNNLQLYDDLVANTDRPGSYLFFIDDANELSGLNLILDYITREKSGYQIKVIMTVRDYAKEEVICEVVKHVKPCLYELSAFSDKEIKDFLKVNMQIMNEQFVDTIIKIAEGNPRIAYMAGKLAKETQSLEAVHDATQVYEQYYATVIQNKLGSNRNLCLTAGILALVKAVMLEKLDCLDQILRIGHISRNEFVDCIRQLSFMEVVEIHRDKVAAISDQCLANYMLYYEFFSRKSIPFSEVLTVGFVHFKEGVIQSVNTLLNLFAKENLHAYITEEVIKTWDKFKQEKEACFDDFVRVFHMFRSEEAFIIASEKIEKIPQEEVTDQHIDFEKGTFRSGEEILGLLTGYKYSHHFETVIELLVEYSQKSDDNAIIGYSWLKNYCCVDIDSCRHDYHAEKIIANKLGEYTNRSSRMQRFVLEYVSYALSFEFRSTELVRSDTFKMYDINLTNSKGVKEYRAVCWKILKKLSQEKSVQDEVYSVIRKYAVSVRGAKDAGIVVDDKPLIMEIVDSLNCSSLNKALIVRDLKYGWEKCDITYEIDDNLFKSSEWNLFELLEDNWIYSSLEYEDYEKQKEKNLLSYADTLSKDEFTNFIEAVALIYERTESQMRYSVIHGTETIVQRVCDDPETAWRMFNAILIGGTNIGIRPDIVLRPLFSERSSQEIWEALDERDFILKNDWQLGFFQVLPEEQVNSYTYELLIDFLKSESDKNIQSSPYRRLHFLDKFESMDQNIYVTASRIIFEKRTYSKFIVEIYFSGLFHEPAYSPEDLIVKYASDMSLLRDIFFFILKNGRLADYKGHFLITFLAIDDSWVDAYAEFVYEKTQDSRDHDYNQYMFLWRSDDYLKYFDRIFEKISDNYDDLYDWRYANVFKAMFVHKENDQLVLERQEKWVLHIVERYATDNRIICLLSAISESRAELRNRAFREFLARNDDYDMFKKIQIDSNHWGGAVNGIIPDLQRRIEFLESLLPYAQGVKYLKHAKRIRDRIDFWKVQIEHEEMEVIYRKLYR